MLEPAKHALRAAWWVLSEAQAHKRPEPVIKGFPATDRCSRGPLQPIETKPVSTAKRPKKGAFTFEVDPGELAPGRYRVVCRVAEPALGTKCGAASGRGSSRTSTVCSLANALGGSSSSRRGASLRGVRRQPVARATAWTDLGAPGAACRASDVDGRKPPPRFPGPLSGRRVRPVRDSRGRRPTTRKSPETGLTKSWPIPGIVDFRAPRRRPFLAAWSRSSRGLIIPWSQVRVLVGPPFACAGGGQFWPLGAGPSRRVHRGPSPVSPPT